MNAEAPEIAAPEAARFGLYDQVRINYPRAPYRIGFVIEDNGGAKVRVRWTAQDGPGDWAERRGLLRPEARAVVPPRAPRKEGLTPMPSRHKHPPISLRLPESDRHWVLTYAKENDLAVNLVLALALAEFRAQRETTATATKRKD